MPKLIAVLCLIALALACRSEAGVERFHVSTRGSDAWSGRVEKPNSAGTDGPFATIHRAQEAVRALKRNGSATPVEVVVHEGTYYLAEALVFTPDDSGTEACPITYRAKGKVVISGGREITGWRRGEGNVWVADVPEAKDGKWSFRLLRVGERWAIQARRPNFDPHNPLTGGWLFAGWHGEPWERGRFGHAVGNIHNQGDQVTWRIRVPADGRYRVWVRYSSKMRDFQVADMAGRTALRVDEQPPVMLSNLPDTGGWGEFRWSHAADMDLTVGDHALAWINVQGGGLGLDAFALTDDEAWNPDEAIGSFSWWGAFSMKPAAEGRHVILIQAEACDKAEGKEITVPQSTPPGETEFMRFAEGDIPALEDISGAEIHIFPAWGWVSAIIPVDRIDYAERKVFFRGGASQEVRMGNRYFVSNVREALDAPGEWYLDRNAGQLLYIAESGRPSKAVAPVLDRLIVLKSEGDRFVEHLRFESFTFTDTDYTLTRDYYTPADAAIRMSQAANCCVSGCEFRWLGGYALRLEGRSRSIEFAGNRVRDMGQGGVLMMGDNASQPHHNLVAGNVMERLGLVYKHVAGVYCITSSDNRIIHNTMRDITRYGIALKTLDANSVSHRNLVEFNDIRRSNLETNDTGAIETLGRDHQNAGNVIRHNLILDSVGMISDHAGRITTPYFTWGIYLDDYSSGTTVYGNIVARTVNGGICVHGGKDNVFENNIFIDAANEQLRLQPRDDFMQGNRFVRNIVAYSKPECRVIYSWDSRRDRFSEWDNNLYWLDGADLLKVEKSVTPEGTFAKWLEAGFDAHSVVADPLFVDPAHDDYRLKPDSPAWKLGFKPIPVEKIGTDWWRKHPDQR